MNMLSILEAEKKRLRPDKEEQTRANVFVSKLNLLIKAKKVNAHAVLGGSVGKGTFLKDSFDVDIFVIFSKSYADTDVSSLLGDVLLPLNPVRVHGSRDYFHVHQDVKFEIVPVLEAKKGQSVKNVTDMSPLHVEYVKEHISKRKYLADEIRLAKQFCKSAGVYGAESHISGFSGHVIDILIIHYGSFLKLLSAAAEEWKAKVILDPEFHHEHPLTALNKAKTESPLVLIDPILAQRNAAAALSTESFVRFCKRAREFLKKPSSDFFELRSLSIKDAKELAYSLKENCELVWMEIEPHEGKQDVSGSKVLKVFLHLQKEIAAHFTLLASNWQFGKPTVMYFLVKKENLSSKVLKKGPPLKNKQRCEDFLRKHPKDELIIQDKHMCAFIPRKYMKPKDLISAKLSDPEIVQKIKSVRKITYTPIQAPSTSTGPKNQKRKKKK